MKTKEFETRKGKFALVDATGVNVLGLELRNITEEQASDIVEFTYNKEKFTEKYLEREYKGGNNAIESLHSLLKSKGVHLFENPYPDAGLMPGPEQQLYRDAEKNTFYNPYIFKI